MLHKVDWKSATLMGLMQACFMSTVMSFLILGGLMGRDFGPDPAYSTLPISAYVLGATVFVIPLSLFMARKGRRLGFMAGACAGIAAGLMCMLGWANSSFAAIFAAGFLVGIVTASNAYLRFAALEITPSAFHGRVTSLVLSGGTIAALVGPSAASALAAGTGVDVYLALGIAMIGFNVMALTLGCYARFAPPSGDGAGRRSPFLKRVGFAFGNPFFLRAITASVTVYAVMLLIMHATPLKMTDLSGYSLGKTEHVMRNHFLAMFVPYIVSGLMLDKFGAVRMVYAGFAMLFGCILCLVGLDSLAGFHAALILLGLGWNFAFLGGTRLVFTSAPKKEAPVTQSVNEFMIACFNFLASVLSGWALYRIGWGGIQLMSLMFMSIALLTFLLFGRKLRNAIWQPEGKAA